METYLWNAVINMTIASYMHPLPRANKQVKWMAKRYLNKTKDKTTRNTLRTVLKSTQPARVVQVAYDELEKM